MLLFRLRLRGELCFLRDGLLTQRQIVPRSVLIGGHFGHKEFFSIHAPDSYPNEFILSGSKADFFRVDQAGLPMMSAVRTTFILSITVAVLGTVFLLTGAQFIVRAFIDDPQTVQYGSQFQRIICLTGPCIPVSMVIIATFQAVGKKVLPLILSMLRKGAVDIPAMFLMNRLVGITGIVWATPIADVVSMVAAILCFIPFWRDLRKKSAEQTQS